MQQTTLLTSNGDEDKDRRHGKQNVKVMFFFRTKEDDVGGRDRKRSKAPIEIFLTS